MTVSYISDVMVPHSFAYRSNQFSLKPGRLNCLIFSRKAFFACDFVIEVSPYQQFALGSVVTSTLNSWMIVRLDSKSMSSREPSTNLFPLVTSIKQFSWVFKQILVFFTFPCHGYGYGVRYMVYVYTHVHFHTHCRWVYMPVYSFL